MVAGEWYSYYDEVTTTDASTFDIDHLVPLAEAWDSGAHAWSAARREAFANDLGDRPRADRGHAHRRTAPSPTPTRPSGCPAYKSCVYVSSWVAVKTRWGLSVDPAEQRTLTRYAASCGKRPLTVRLAKLRGSTVADARPSDADGLPAQAHASLAEPDAVDRRRGHQLRRRAGPPLRLLHLRDRRGLRPLRARPRPRVRLVPRR